MVREQALLQIKREHCLNRAQVQLLLLGTSGERLNSTQIDELVDPAALLLISLLLQIGQKLSKVEVADQVALLAFLVADRAFVQSIHSLHDAGFAESMAALSNVWIVKRLEANDALGEFAYNLLDADFDLLIELRPLSLKRWWILDHLHV